MKGTKGGIIAQQSYIPGIPTLSIATTLVRIEKKSHKSQGFKNLEYQNPTVLPTL